MRAFALFRGRGALVTRCEAHPKNGFNAPAAHTLQRGINKLCEKTDITCGWGKTGLLGRRDYLAKHIFLIPATPEET